MKSNHRDRAYLRHHRKRIIQNKKEVVKRGAWYVPDEQYGRLTKGKVHCSCPSCSVKTNRCGYPHAQKARWEGRYRDGLFQV